MPYASSEPVDTETHVDAATLLVRAFKRHGVRVMMGLVGIPIISVATAAQRLSIPFYAFRNEQAASYGASVVGYLSDCHTPAVSLSCGGPGVIHALAGIANAYANCWPLVHVCATPDTRLTGTSGAFQELPVTETVAPYVKYSVTVRHASMIPVIVERCIRESMCGRPGPTFIDIPADVLATIVDKSTIQWCLSTSVSVPRPLADPRDVRAALSLLQSSSRPLVIIGKGASYSGAVDSVRQFINSTRIPFLTTSGGAGVVPDDHPLSTLHARPYVLGHADTILLIGVRLNWQLHFGLPPKYSESAKFIQIDISPEELTKSRNVDVGLCGDANQIVQQLNSALTDTGVKFGECTEWKLEIAKRILNTQARINHLICTASDPINYYNAYDVISRELPSNALVVTEGGNTVFIGRSMILVNQPRSRIDLGTLATLGLGIGYAVASHALLGKERRIVAIEGDSAFGFSAADYETAVRYKQDIVFIIFNNSGIFHGSDASAHANSDGQPLAVTIPVTALSARSRYDQLATMFDPVGTVSKGWLVENSTQLSTALKAAFEWRAGPSIVNILMTSDEPERIE